MVVVILGLHIPMIRISYYIILSRTYLNTRLDLGRHVDLWFKYTLSWYPDRRDEK
jgi:hypothetical protein